MSRGVFLSACLIVRDAAEDLDWCLASLADEVDEIIVVDTGSQDASRSIARRYARHVYSFAWQDDFSAARNFALQKAHGMWVFFPDSDEQLAGEKGALRRAVKGAEGLGERALSLLRREVDEAGRPANLPDNPAVRILRRGGGLAYHDTIHEYLAYPDGSTPEAPLAPSDELFLYHRGYAPSRKAAKAERNLRLLERAEREGRPKLHLHYYLSGLYFDTGRYEDACREAEMSLSAGEHPAAGALEVWRNYAGALEKLGRTEELEAFCRRAVREVPELPDMYARLGVAAMNREDFATGERLLLEAQRREAAFTEACPRDFDTFRAALPQVEQFLEMCRERMAAKQEGEKTMKDEGAQTHRETPKLEVEAEYMASLLPPSAKTVVLFGCDTGAAATAFLRRSPVARVYGFAADRATAVAASRVMQGTFVGEPDMVELADFGIQDVDCIAFAPEACAHLTESCLHRHVASLAPNGQMVFLLPNPAYLGTVLSAASGIAASQTFFTPGQLTRMLRTAGMQQVFLMPQIRSEGGRLQQDAEAGRLVAAIDQYARAHGITAAAGRESFAESYVIRAARQEEQTVAVQTLVGEVPVTSRPRVLEPDGFCRTTPGWFYRASSDGSFHQALAKQMQTSVIVRHRMNYENKKQALDTIRRLRNEGHMLVYECDDNPALWQESLVATKYLDFRGSHAVQVSTEALAEIVRPYNPHVFVFENQLAELPEVRDYAAEEAAHPGRATVFFGAVNREAEWREIVPALNAAAKRYGDRLWFQIVADRSCYDMLETEYKEFLGDPEVYEGKFVPYKEYQRALHTSDIALLPLRDTEFNRTKSDLKFIESAGHGAVVLASPTVYERTVVDGCTGCIYHNPEEFSEKLARLIEDAPYRHAIADAAYGYVRKHRLLSQHYMERIRAYTWLIEHREELDRELEERLKGL